MMFGCGDSLRKACISLRLFTYTPCCYAGTQSEKAAARYGYLYTLQAIYLLQAVEMIFHAFDGYISAVLYTLGLEHL